MNQTWVRNYLERYLEIHQCQFIERQPGYTTVKLSVEVDKDITNRPYYWTFVERTNADPETLTMTFIFDKEKTPDDLRGEVIKFGSERLKQFFKAANKRGKMVRLYQQLAAQPSRNTMKPLQTLQPWLIANFKIEFISDQKKDLIISLGINLSTGEMKENFSPVLKKMMLSPVLPANNIIDSPFLTLREAALQLEEWIMNEIFKEDFHWVSEANNRLQKEIEQIEAYYENNSLDTKKENDDNRVNDVENSSIVEKEKRIEEVKWQYAPRVEVNPINFGLFYLDKTIQKNVEYIH